YLPNQYRPLPGRLAAYRDGAAWKIGSPRQQLSLLCERRAGSVAYAADQQSLRGLALMRGRRRFSTPIVTVVHHPLAVTPENRTFVRGIDVALCLNRRVQRQLV